MTAAEVSLEVVDDAHADVCDWVDCPTVWTPEADSYRPEDHNWGECECPWCAAIWSAGRDGPQPFIGRSVAIVSFLRTTLRSYQEGLISKADLAAASEAVRTGQV